MNSILILGAGRSSSSLISYLLKYSEGGRCSVTVGDSSQDAARERIGPMGKAIAFDITDWETSREVISRADVVVSLLPAHFHPTVARICLDTQKHLLTASYVSDEMKAFDNEAKSKSLLLLNECGLDPGIDHMSAMHVIDRIHTGGGRLFSFESFTGGLIAPETAPDNPWRYKFTWNARNVVMAGQATARFLQNQQYKYIPYQQLFKRTTPVVVPGHGSYEGYANRDSLRYLETYNLRDIQTMLRGTLRHRGFCSAWNIFVQLGCCDDGYEMEDVAALTHRDFINSFLDSNSALTVEQKICKFFSLPENGPEVHKLRWSGFFDEEKVGLNRGTPAQILEHILNKKWKLEKSDKDMVVMWHRFGYELHGARKEIQASLVAIGTDAVHTAMARTVGYPLGIATRLLIEGKITRRGVVVPTEKEIYEPVLAELRSLGIQLNEEERTMNNE